MFAAYGENIFKKINTALLGKPAKEGTRLVKRVVKNVNPSSKVADVKDAEITEEMVEQEKTKLMKLREMAKSKWPWILGGTGVLILTGVGIYLMVSKKDK